MAAAIIAAELAAWGIRVTRIGSDYLFTGMGYNFCTFDSDFLNQLAACDRVDDCRKYLRTVNYRGNGIK